MQYHGSSNGIDGRLEVYKAFAPTYPVVQAWGRMALATIIMFAMPATCLRHLKTWSWPASIVILAACCAATVLLIAPMLPHTTRIGYLYNPTHCRTDEGHVHHLGIYMGHRCRHVQCNRHPATLEEQVTSCVSVSAIRYQVGQMLLLLCSQHNKIASDIVWSRFLAKHLVHSPQ